jgi:hypothetical protein
MREAMKNATGEIQRRTAFSNCFSAILSETSFQRAQNLAPYGDGRPKKNWL